MFAAVDGQDAEVVIATAKDIAKLQFDLAEGVYVVGTGSTGMWGLPTGRGTLAQGPADDTRVCRGMTCTLGRARPLQVPPPRWL